MILKPGDLIRNYRVLDYIGEGGMGKVYAAEEELLGRKVAIKMLDPAITHHEHFRQRFINEARIQANLQHPNIVGLLSFFSEQDNYFMAMEYAEGQTLRDLIATIGPVPEQRSRRILRQILAALNYANDKGVVHRDIKPSNIMIGDRDEVKILDFGVARILADPHSTLTGSRVGTIYYMSPEQVRTPREVDGRSDIYSSGVVLFEMLTGQLPFNAQTESDFLIEKEIVESALPNPREYYPYMSDLIVDLMHSMTAKEPLLRPAATEAIDALDTDSMGSIIIPAPAVEKPVPVVPITLEPVLPPKPKKMPSGLRAFLIILIVSILIFTIGYALKWALEINPDLFRGLTKERFAEEVIEEEGPIVVAPSDEELAAIKADKQRQETQQTIRKLRPRFDTVAKGARTYRDNDPFGDWPLSLDLFMDPKEVDTGEFSFVCEDGKVIAISNRAFGKAGIEIYYNLDTNKFDIFDPDPQIPPNVNPGWLN